MCTIYHISLPQKTFRENDTIVNQLKQGKYCIDLILLRELYWCK